MDITVILKIIGDSKVDNKSIMDKTMHPDSITESKRLGLFWRMTLSSLLDENWKLHYINPKGKYKFPAARAAPGDLGLKSHPKDYQQKLTYHNGHPSKYRPRPMLLNPNVQGGWQ